MGKQKAVIRARREAKRVVKRDGRSQRQREEDQAASLVQMGGIETIGMARENAITRQSRPERKRRSLICLQLNPNS